MRNWAVGFLLLAFLLPAPTRAEVLNVGFVEGLWYSGEPVFVGVPTRVYVAFRNNTPHDLTGTIRFTDNGKRIGSSYVSVLSGRIAEAWIDWTPTEGEHALGATLSDAELHKIGAPSEPIEVAGIVAEDAVTVEYDTDKDGVGNTADPDDDGDGVSDEDERAGGTDPLRANPKPVSEKREETEKTKELVVETVRETETTEVIRPGLEQYLPDGVVASVVGGITDEVHDIRETLDAYRKERNEALYQKELAPSASAPTSDTATITRSTIETKGGFFDALFGGVVSIFKNIYTFILFLLSGVLARPAFVELLFLLLVLYLFYRTARRLGSRPNW